VQRISAFTLLLLALSVHSQDLSGYVVDGKSKLPLHGAHIRNITKKQLATSGADGGYEIPVSEGDTLAITFIGYHDYFMVINSDLMQQQFVISMQEKETTLDDIVVTPYSEYPIKPRIELDQQKPYRSSYQK
jgi:hypothetical protein